MSTPDIILSSNGEGNIRVILDTESPAESNPKFIQPLYTIDATLSISQPVPKLMYISLMLKGKAASVQIQGENVVTSVSVC